MMRGSDGVEVELDAARLAMADRTLHQGLQDQVYSAAVLLVAHCRRVVHVSSFGTTQPGGGYPVGADTLFDLASLTKPVVALGLLALVEDGVLSLGDPLEAVLPEAAGTPVAAVTLRHLATHTSGLPPWRPVYRAGLSATGTPEPDARRRMLDETLRIPLHDVPGTRYAYSDLGYLLLGEAVSRAAGMGLQEYLRGRIFNALGLEDLGYLPSAGQSERIAATANSSIRPGRMLIGEVHDENAWVFGGVAGHAGLFGTAKDLAVLAIALAGDGTAEGRRLLSLPALRLCRTNQLAPAVGGHSIGWFTPPNSMLPRGDLLSEAAFGHTGFTGTMIVIDPVEELAVVLLTNRVVNPADNGGIQRIRRSVLNAIASAIGCRERSSRG
ncbi:MAG: serine hydrolase domain-containing protein [Chthonomonadales bacterium]